ncbi:hypothetical protein MGAST_20615 [Mycobacterium gastri 'Wayne']|nr:hypothetical protein MGAST_20615 [Mycobacterium gastri 'Wayne']
MPLLAVPGKAAFAGGFEPGLACFADGLPSSFRFVVGRDVSDAGMQPDRIPELAGDGDFGAQGGGVLDCEQVRKLGLGVPV